MFVFDTGSFIVLGHYYPAQFPSFWEQFNGSVKTGLVVSCREVHRELTGHGSSAHLQAWIKTNKHIFHPPDPQESAFVAQVFAVPHFGQLVTQKQQLKGSPVADPFVIASAKIRNATVVTEELFKPNAAKIPNVCSHFGVPCMTLEKFLQTQNWTF